MGLHEAEQFVVDGAAVEHHESEGAGGDPVRVVRPDRIGEDVVESAGSTDFRRRPVLRR